MFQVVAAYSDINTVFLQGSVASHLRCGGMF